MGKEAEPKKTEKLGENLSVRAIDGGENLVTVCHNCAKILYSSADKNPLAKKVAEFRAQDHGNFFSPGHHVSVVCGESTKEMKELLAVNEIPQKKNIQVHLFPTA